MEQELNVKKHSSFKTKLGTSFATFIAMSCVAHSYAFANTPADALKRAGITGSSIQGEGADSFFSSLQNVVYLVMAAGGFWGILWLVIGGMMLAGSGSNPQKRSGGIAALAVAAVGIFVIYKAYDIAGWAVNLGGETGAN